MSRSTNEKSDKNQRMLSSAKGVKGQLGNKRKKNKEHYFKSLTALSNVQDEKSEVASKPHTTKTSAKWPTKPDEASSNWKNLCKVIKPAHTYRRGMQLSSTTTEERKLTAEKLTDKSMEASEVWFDDVDPILLDTEKQVVSQDNVTTTNGGSSKPTNILAMDCEMVGIGSNGEESALARVSIVNQFGECVYDKFVLPGDEVTDYRTQYSGIRAHNLKNAIDLGTVRHEVSTMLRGRILVGHGLHNDLEVLLTKHPKSNIRDTSRYKHFRTIVNGATPSLKKLAQHFLGIEIQTGEHSSIQDAQAAMRLYTMFRQQWEADLSSRRADRKSKVVKRVKKTLLN